MLSLPDFREKQILFIKNSDIQENKIKFNNENICFVENGQIKNQASCHKIFTLFIMGDCSITTVLFKKCQKYGVSIFLMKDNFEVYATILSVAEGNYLARIKQYNINKDVEIAKNLVKNKIENQIYLLNKNKNLLSINYLEKLRQRIDLMENEKMLLGIEGTASKFFFENYFSSIGWYRRMPRTKVDIINLLMDLGYTMLFNFIDALVGLYGLDPYKGFYHKLFFQRKSLICDLVEPFRFIIDKQILKSYNLKQIDKKDFKLFKGSYRFIFDKRKKYLKIFADVIMENKEKMFLYVRNFYYFIMNDSTLPFFIIEK